MQTTTRKLKEKPKSNEESESEPKGSVPTLISVTGATAEAYSLSFSGSHPLTDSVAVPPAVAAVPLLQSQQGFVSLESGFNHKGFELIPALSGVNNQWGSQFVGSPNQFNCLQYSNMYVPIVSSPNLKRKVESGGNFCNHSPVPTFFCHMPDVFCQDSGSEDEEDNWWTHESNDRYYFDLVPSPVCSIDLSPFQLHCCLGHIFGEIEEVSLDFESCFIFGV